MQNIAEVKHFLELQQLGMSVAGAQKLVFSVRSLLNLIRDFVCVKVDMRDAYNEQSRGACIDIRRLYGGAFQPCAISPTSVL